MPDTRKILKSDTRLIATAAYELARKAISGDFAYEEPEEHTLDARYLRRSQNLEDLNNAGTARTNLELKALATLDTVDTAQIEDEAVTLAKIQDISTSHILGRIAAGAGIVEQLDGADVRTITSTLEHGTEDGQIRDNEALDVRYVEVAGDTMTGDLTLAKNSSILDFSSETGVKQIQTGGTTDLALMPGGNVGFNKTTDIDYKFDFNGVGRFSDDLFPDNNIGSISYASGFTGHGWRYDKPTARLTLDNLTVRKQLRVYELLIEQIRANRGAIVVSPGDVIVDFVVGDKAYVDTGDDDRFPLSIVMNDLIRCQRWSGSGTKYYIAEVTETGVDTGGDYDGRYWFKWTIIDGADDVEAGDEAVVFGNTTDTDRQGLLYLTASDDNAPYLDILDGVVSDDLTGKIKVRLGKLDGIVDPDFGGALDGYGLYSNNVYLKGKLVVTEGSNLDAAEAVWPSSEELKGYWSFDEGSGNVAKDNSGTDNDGTLNTAEGNFTDGVSGLGWLKTSLSTNAAVTIPHHASISFSTDDSWTLSTWVRIDQLGAAGNRNSILHKGSTADSYGISIYEVNIRAGIRYGTTRREVDFYAYANIIYHVCLVVDGTAGILHLYVDGTLIGSRSFDNTEDYGNTDNWEMLSDRGISGISRTIRGFVDEPRIYSRALSEREVKGLCKQIARGDNTSTIIQGGLITSGRIELGDADGNVWAGVHGGGTDADSTRFWAGTTFANSSTAPFRVQQDGKLVSSYADIAGWDITATSIKRYDSVTNEEVDLSSANRELVFRHAGEAKARFSANAIDSLSTLLNPESGTHNPSFDESHSLVQNESFQAYSGTFEQEHSAGIEVTLRLRYTKSGFAGYVWGNISGTVYLADDGGEIIKAIGSFDETFTDTGDRSIIVASSTMTPATCTIRYHYWIIDGSTTTGEPGGKPTPGSFRLGGDAAADHKVEWTQERNETAVGRDGMYSFWGDDKYFYLNPAGVTYLIRSKGGTEFLSGTGNAHLQIFGSYIDIKATASLSFINVNHILTDLPTSNPGVGILWKDGTTVKVGT